MVDVSGCSATLNGTELSGTFEVVNSETVPNVGDKYRLKFMSEDGKYIVESEEFSAEIQPKPLTITAESAEKVYDGEPLVRNSYMADGLVNGDEITKVIVSGTLTDAGEMSRRMQEMQKMYHIMQKYAETVQIRRKITQSAMPMVR